MSYRVSTTPHSSVAGFALRIALVLVALTAAGGVLVFAVSAGLAPVRAFAAWALAVLVAGILIRHWELRRRAGEEAERSDLERLARAQKMEAVGRLAGGIAHDVNNHLATIRAHAEWVSSSELPREQIVARMSTIRSTVLKASSLIERLLTFARRQPTRPEVVRLNDVVEDFTALMRGSLPAGIEIREELASDSLEVEVDLGRIDQVLANLFVNARDALPGRGTITISTARVGDGAEVELVVRDDGRGIPPEVLPQIFEPFFTTKSGHGASGLGLATVHAAIEEAGGRVEVESTLGAGSKFRIVLPAARKRPAPAPPAPALRPRETSQGRGERLLLVDDNRDLGEAVEGQLEAAGYRVTRVETEDEALAAAEREPFALVITDVHLRGELGTELVRKLRERAPREVPVRALYMSGYTDRIDLRRGGDPAAAYFLKKPFSGEGLVRMVGELLAEPVNPPPSH